MKAKIQLTCALCGKQFRPGNDSDGVPNGLGFRMESGTIYNICGTCVAHRYKEAADKIKEEERKRGFGT